MLHPIEVEIFRVVQIGEPAFHQRANEIEGHRRAFVSAQKKLWVGDARFRCEFGAIDVIAAKSG